MFSRAPIPDRYSSLMPQERQARLQDQKTRSVSHASQASQTSIASSTISEFLENKIRSCQLDIDYIQSYRDGLHEALSAEKLAEEDYRNEFNCVFGELQPRRQELRVLKRQKKIIQEDLEDDFVAKKRYRGPDDEPDIGLLERAYTSTIVSRVMSATAKQKKRSFDQSAFKKDVLAYYGAGKIEGNYRLAFCHVVGAWFAHDDVKAAHLVPKSLSGAELSYLFGVGELILSDKRNGKFIFPFTYSATKANNVIPRTFTSQENRRGTRFGHNCHCPLARQGR